MACACHVQHLCRAMQRSRRVHNVIFPTAIQCAAAPRASCVSCIFEQYALHALIFLQVCDGVVRVFVGGHFNWRCSEWHRRCAVLLRGMQCVHCTSLVAEDVCVVQSFAEMIHLLLTYFVFVRLLDVVLRFSGSLYTGMLNSPFTPLSPAPLDTVVRFASLATLSLMIAAAISTMIKTRCSAFVSNSCRAGSPCRYASRTSPCTRLCSCRRATGVLHTPFVFLLLT